MPTWAPKPKNNTSYPWRSRAIGVTVWIYWSAKPDQDTRIELMQSRPCMPKYEGKAMPKFNHGKSRGADFGTLYGVERNPYYKQPERMPKHAPKPWRVVDSAEP